MIKSLARLNSKIPNGYTKRKGCRNLLVPSLVFLQCVLNNVFCSFGNKILS